MLTKLYLVSYNTIQFLGWSFLFYQMASHLAGGGPVSELYAATATSLQIFQTGALLEILHAGFGLVRSSVQVTVQQVWSRVYVTWLILHMLPPTQLSIGFPMLLFAWTVTEMIRYSMYAINLVSTPPYFLTWLRYTFFIIAYPTGVSGELLCQLQGLTHAYKQNILSVSLPNSLNASFSFPLFILVTMLLYIPLFPPMYMHMFGQRKKVLGAKKEE